MEFTVTLPRVLSIDEANKAFPVSPGLLRRAIQRGELEGLTPNGHKLLVQAKDVYEWIGKYKYKRNRRDA